MSVSQFKDQVDRLAVEASSGAFSVHTPGLVRTSSCREVIMYYAKNEVVSGHGHLVSTRAAVSMYKCMTYMNRIEKVFGFNGYLTSIVHTGEERKGLRSYVFSLNSEWLSSPVLYQTALFILRIFSMDTGEDIYKGIRSFRKTTPFSCIDADKVGATKYTTHLANLQKIGYTLLNKRSTLFYEGVAKEWSSDEKVTPYGGKEISYAPSTSGPTSLYMCLSDIDSKVIHYFKQNTRRELFKEVFSKEIAQ